MTAYTLLYQLHELGVILTPSPDGTLRYKALKGTMTPALLDAIRQQKAALHDLAEGFEERAGIMEHEGGLSRDDAKWQALRCVQGKASP